MANKTEVKIQDNTAKQYANLVSAVSAGLEQWVKDVENDAKTVVPVDTGALRDSISSTVTVQPGNHVVTVKADKDYAAYVEFGTVKAPAQPFLFPAVFRGIPKIANVIKVRLR